MVGAVTDLVIRGGLIVDGTGAPGFVADVAVSGGRIVEVGTVDHAMRASARVVDAGGLVVAPGFVDLHTHYDAQLFYEPELSPSPLHGVTTVVAGNCGLSLAPVNAGDESWLTRLLARVEAIPVTALEAGLEYRWRTYPEFLDVVERSTLGPNVGFLVGHSALRRAVMGPAASAEPATEQQLAAMIDLLDAAIAAGGFGFSTATAATQLDGDGLPTPPNFATRDEFVALATVCGRHPGTVLEFIPDSFLSGFTDEDVELMADMSAAANRVLNWNKPLVNPRVPDLHERQLRACTVAEARGGRVVPMMTPQNGLIQHDFEPGYVFRAMPGWGWLFDLDPHARREALRDPANRDLLERAAAEATEGLALVVRNWHQYRVSEVPDPAHAGLVGRAIADLAREWGCSPFSAMAEVVTRAGIETSFVRPQFAADDEWSWEARRVLLTDPRVVLQASDAGAHLDMMCGASYPSETFAELVRDRQLFTIEEMVHQFSGVPAALYGLHELGRIAPGARADLVVFDPAEFGPTALQVRRDLPGGAARLQRNAVGVAHVFVNGEELVRDGHFTGRAPGRLLRSGRDSVTVPARATADRRRR
jgi:N-acyl-D-aspartate/D-glutamate deacylase